MDNETYQAFSPVTVMSRRPGQMINIGTAYDATKFFLEDWPPERGGPLVLAAMHALHNCLAGELAPAIARVAFIEPAREANIYVPRAEIRSGYGRKARSKMAL